MPRDRKPAHIDRYSRAKKTFGADYVDYEHGDTEALSLMPELSLLDAANRKQLAILADDVDKGTISHKELIKAAQQVAHSRSELTRAETDRRARMSELYTTQEVMEIMRIVMRIIQDTVTNKYEIANIGRQIQQVISGVGDRPALGEHGGHREARSLEEAEPSELHGGDDEF